MKTRTALSLALALFIGGCATDPTDDGTSETQEAPLLDSLEVGDLDADCFDQCVKSFAGTSSEGAQRALEKSCRLSCAR